MSTSLLYHVFGIRGYAYVRTEYHRGQVFFTIRQNPGTRRCLVCGSKDVRARGHAERRFKCLPTDAEVIPSHSNVMRWISCVT